MKRIWNHHISHKLWRYVAGWEILPFIEKIDVTRFMWLDLQPSVEYLNFAACGLWNDKCHMSVGWQELDKDCKSSVHQSWQWSPRRENLTWLVTVRKIGWLNKYREYCLCGWWSFAIQARDRCTTTVGCTRSPWTCCRWWRSFCASWRRRFMRCLSCWKWRVWRTSANMPRSCCRTCAQP